MLALATLLLFGCTGNVADPLRSNEHGADPDSGQPSFDSGPEPVLDAGTSDASPIEDAAAPLDAAEPEPDAAADSGMPEPPPPPPPPPPVLFSKNGGGFTAPFELTLSPGNPDDEVRCTLDGSEPTITSALCDDAAKMIDTTTLVRAIAVHKGIQTAEQQQLYIEVGADAQAFDSSLPIVVVHTLGAAPPDQNSHEYMTAAIAVFDPPSGRTSILGDAAVTSRTGFKVRGRSTRSLPKHSYSIELWGALQEEKKLPLLGMPAEGDWALYAPYTYDRSLMRNAFMYALSNQLGRWAPRTRFCELFVVTGQSALNAASYNGVYVLMERITRGAKRLNIPRMAPTDTAMPNVSGGYIFAQDDPDGTQTFSSQSGADYVWVDPKPELVVPEQVTYLSNEVSSIERALAAPSGTDATTNRHYGAIIDTDAFIDNHILNVFAKNPDAFALSSYFYKDRSGKIVAGPIWDFDLAMGGNDPWGNRSVDPNTWGPSANDTLFERGFFGALFTHSEFESQYWTRWDEVLAGPMSQAKLDATIDAFAAELTEAELRNRARWPEAAPRNDSYMEEVGALKTWLQARRAFVAGHLGTVP